MSTKIIQSNIRQANIKGKWVGIFKPLDDGKTLLDFTEEIEDLEGELSR